MPNVVIHTDWSFTGIMRQTPGGLGKWEDFTFSENTHCSSNIDLLLVLNKPSELLYGTLPEGRKWLFMQEPPTKYRVSDQKSYKYFDRVYSFWPDGVHANKYTSQTCLPWYIDRSYDELVNLEYSELAKKDAVSWVTSDKSHLEGHQLRLNFLDYLRSINFPLDLFGRGFSFVEDKFNALDSYKYSIAIENFSVPHFWTEKIADCFLAWTMPIYWGDPQITNYFPERSMILVDPACPKEAVEKIEKAIAENWWDKNLDAIAEARDLVLNKYQLFPNIAEKLRAAGVGGKRKFFVVPPNGSLRRYVKRKVRSLF